EKCVVFTKLIVYLTSFTKTYHLTAIIFHEVDGFCRIAVSLIPWLVCFKGHPCGDSMVPTARDGSCFEQYFSAFFCRPFLPFFESLVRSIHGFFHVFVRCHGGVSDFLLRICWVNGCQFFIGVDLFATDNKWVIFAQFTFHFFECRYIIVTVLLILEIGKCFVFIW